MATVRKLDIQISGESKDAEKAFDRLGKAAQDAEKQLGKVGESNPFGKLSDAADDAGGGLMDKFSSLGDGAMAALSGGITAGAGVLAVGAAAAAGVFVDAFGQALEQESDTARLSARLGLSDEDAERAGKLAGDLWTSGFGSSFSDITDAIALVQQDMAGLTSVSQDGFEDIATRALTVSDVFGQDLAGSVNAVAQMIRTGLVPDATDAFDIIARGVQLGGDKAGDLLDTFNEYPTQFRKLGLSGADAMGLIIQGLQAGARDSDIVADSLKEFSIRAVDMSDSTREGFRLLGMDADEMMAKIAAGGPTAREGLGQVLSAVQGLQDPLAQGKVATDLFGTQWEDMGAALNGMDLSQAAATMGEWKGTVDDASSAYDTNSAKLESLKRQGMQVLVDYIGNTLIPKLYEGKIWFARNAEAIQNMGDTAARVGHFLATAFTGWLDWTAAGVHRITDTIRLAVAWFDRLADMARDAMGAIGDALNKLSQATKMPSFGPGPGGFLGGFFAGMFDEGGVVPGPVGSAQLAVVHGGETIVPTHQPGVALGVAGGGGGVIVNVTVQGSLVMERDIVKAVNRGLARGHALYDSSGGVFGGGRRFRG